ncbi:phage protein NinX family protein [Robbsia andropogonis]|uniref:phage protein NinX family protein n=1 Tax=Robbsia andropogonis TaxID=28092 RepID=UPI003D1D0196
MKVSELTGVQLDYWVALAENACPEIEEWELPDGKSYLICYAQINAEPSVYKPSSDWSCGGPIIERDQIYLSPPHDAHYYGGPNAGWKRYDDWSATVSARTRTLPPNSVQLALKTGGGVGRGRGDTPLLAAMRAKVASHYGDEVPDELPASIGGAS